VILVLQVLVGFGFSDSIDKLNWKPLIKRQQIYINEKKKDDCYYDNMDLDNLFYIYGLFFL
jgi:hypothetical protein